MANEYTSIATTGGIADNTVTMAYDLVINAAYRSNNLLRENFVSKRPERPSHNGSSVRLQKHAWFGAAAVTAAKTPLNEELDVDSTKLPTTTYVDVSVNEYGFAVTSTKKLHLLTFDNIDAYGAQAIGYHLADTMDSLIADVAEEDNTTYTWTGAASADSSITAAPTYAMKAQTLRDQKIKFRTRNVPGWDQNGGLHAAIMHPHCVADLREETGSGGWRLPQEYGTDQSKLWSGEFGAFEGFRVVEYNKVKVTTTGASSAKVYRNYFIGPEAIAEVVKEEPHFVVGPTVDKLGRFHTTGWYGALGWKTYRPESLITVRSGSTKSALA